LSADGADDNVDVDAGDDVDDGHFEHFVDGRATDVVDTVRHDDEFDNDIDDDHVHEHNIVVDHDHDPLNGPARVRGRRTTLRLPRTGRSVITSFILEKCPHCAGIRRARPLHRPYRLPCRVS
jgi:hypothetical protein